MDRLVIKIKFRGCVEVRAGERAVNTVLFEGHCEGGLFEGEILPAACDVQKLNGAGGTLSARYILEGVDCAGECCRIFVENNGTVGQVFTEPAVLTDSRALSWLNTERLAGRLTEGDDGLTVEIGRFEDIWRDNI